MNIYESNNYRKILSELVSAKKFLDKAISFQNMAAHMRIQKPYLSKVINGSADLNSDQLYMACVYLELNEEDTNYLLLLLEYERSTFKRRRDLLHQQIEKIQFAKRDSKNVLKKNTQQLSGAEFDQTSHIEYYLDPIFVVVHVLLTLPKYLKNPNRIAEELHLSNDEFQEILKKLVSMNIIEIKDSKIVVLMKSIHLPRESKVVVPHQNLMRQLSQQRLTRLNIDQKKSIFVTFAADEKARKEIEVEFNHFIAKVQNIVLNSEKSGCYQLNFDLFPWTINLSK